MAIIAILVAILVPAVNRVRANARSTQSKNNLSELGTAMKNYEGAHQRNLKATDWEQKLLPYTDNVSKVFIDPANTDGEVSYALSNKVVLMGLGDDKKIAIIESNDRIIELNTDDCSGTAPNIIGTPVARHLGMTNALLYGGAVRSLEPAEISLTDTTNEPLVVWWLPTREHGMVCGTVVVIDNPNPSPSPTGSEPDSTLTPEPTSEPPCVPITGRYVRVRREVTDYMHLAEVIVLTGDGINAAQFGTATQSSTYGGRGPARAIDGNANGALSGNSISNTDSQANPWWRVDLSSDTAIHQVQLWNRTDNYTGRLSNAIVEILDASSNVVWTGQLPNMVGVNRHEFEICPLDTYDPDPTDDPCDAIDWTSGTVQVNSTLPPSFESGAVESNQYVQLYLEQCGIALPEDVTVDWTPTGFEQVYNGNVNCSLTSSMIPAGTVVDVYFVHFDTVTQYLVLTGEIQFSRPILGMIFPRGTDFATTDALLGGSSTTYPNDIARGFECSAADGETVILSEDAKNLFMELVVSSSIDQARIIVAHED